MRSRYPSIVILLAIAGVMACAGSAYLPGTPGSPNSDISGQDVRTQWLNDHPEVDEEVRTAIEQGVFVAGMNVEQRDLVTNPDRRGTTGDGFWRSREEGIEVRYQWFVGGTRIPFQDGLGRKVCELIYIQGRLREVRYCGLATESPE
jgi:hypothetical protein